MGKRKYSAFSNRVLAEKDWQDLVITTALLLGADNLTRQPMDNPSLRTFNYPQAHRWQRMSKWLWIIHGMHVRKDGTIYQRPNDREIDYSEYEEPTHGKKTETPET